MRRDILRDHPPRPPSVGELTAGTAIVFGCARDAAGFNPGALAAAIDLLTKHDGAAPALVHLIGLGVTGSRFYEYWQGVTDTDRRLAELSRAFHYIPAIER